MAFKFSFNITNNYIFEIPVYDTSGAVNNFIDFSVTEPKAMIKLNKEFISSSLTEENKNLDPMSNPGDVTNSSLIDIGGYHNILLFVPGMGELLIDHVADPSDFEYPSGKRAVIIRYKAQDFLVKYDIPDDTESFGLMPYFDMTIDRYGTLHLAVTNTAMNRQGVFLDKSRISLSQ